MLTRLICRFPQATCWVLFAIAMAAFMYVWRWFIFQHDASFIEWAAAMAVILALGFYLERRLS